MLVKVAFILLVFNETNSLYDFPFHISKSSHLSNWFHFDLNVLLRSYA